MKSKNDIRDRSGSRVEIKPVPFHPAQDEKRSRFSRMLKWFLGLVFGIFLMLLCASAWFVFTARQVVIRIDPKPDHFSIKGGMITPKIGDYYLLRSGAYVLETDKACFQPLQKEFAVTEEKNQSFNFSMTRQPGYLSFQVHQVNRPATRPAGALIRVDRAEPSF